MTPPEDSARAFAPAGLATTELASPRSLAEACALLAEARRAGLRVMVPGRRDRTGSSTGT